MNPAQFARKPELLTTYLRKKQLRLISVDINVKDITIGIVEVTETRVKLVKVHRVKRPINIISFVRRVNMESQRI